MGVMSFSLIMIKKLKKLITIISISSKKDPSLYTAYMMVTTIFNVEKQ